MSNEQFYKSCFISASYLVDTKSIKNLLKKYKINWHDSTDILPGTEGYAKVVEKQIKNSDFLIAIITSDHLNNVFFEIGLSRGLSKPVFIIVNEDINIFTFSFSNFVYVITSINNIEAIEFSLSRFLSEFPKKTEYPLHSKTDIQEPLDLKKINKQLESLKKDKNFRGIESLIFELLIRSKDVEGKQNLNLYSGREVDISLWVEGIESVIGNPVIIEIKAGNISKKKLIRTEIQLRHYMKTFRSPLGLLIYFDFEGHQFYQSNFEIPLVFWFDIHELVNSLSHKSLAEIIREKRNKWAHGGSVIRFG